jgi:AcrR family transcriptional regulator
MPDPSRPRRRRKEARPAEIIDAGLQEFALHGFAATRMEDVAARAGIAKGTIYRYFEDKETLFIAAIRSRLFIFSGSIQEQIDSFPGHSSDLLRLLFTHIHQTMDDPEVRVLEQIFLSEGARFPVLTELYHREVLSHGRALLARVVARGVARGEFREGPATSLPMVLIAPALLAVFWKMNFQRHETISPEAFLQAHLDLVLHGIELPRPSAMP